MRDVIRCDVRRFFLKPSPTEITTFRLEHSELAEKFKIKAERNREVAGRQRIGKLVPVYVCDTMKH